MPQKELNVRVNCSFFSGSSRVCSIRSCIPAQVSMGHLRRVLFLAPITLWVLFGLASCEFCHILVAPLPQDSNFRRRLLQSATPLSQLVPKAARRKHPLHFMGSGHDNLSHVFVNRREWVVVWIIGMFLWLWVLHICWVYSFWLIVSVNKFWPPKIFSIVLIGQIHARNCCSNFIANCTAWACWH